MLLMKMLCGLQFSLWFPLSSEKVISETGGHDFVHDCTG